MLSKLTSWIPQFLSPPASDPSGSSQPAPANGADAQGKDVRPSAQKLMQRCMGDERENLRKRATMFLDAIEMHEADNNQGEVKDLKKALDEVNKNLAELNKTCQEAANQEESKHPEPTPKAKPKTERKAKHKPKGTLDTPKDTSSNGEPSSKSYGEMIIRSEILINPMARERLIEIMGQYRAGEKFDLKHLKQGQQIEIFRVLPQTIEVPKTQSHQNSPKK